MTTGPSDTTLATSIVGLLGGMFVFGPLVGLFAPFFFLVPIVGIGVAFGLTFGVLVRSARGRS
jgi:hypothetical protein